MIAARKTLLATAAFAVTALTADLGSAHERDQVVASIKPVHSLVAGVMEGVGEPHLIVKGAGSPHAFSLKPSDAEALEHATAVFWIGEDLETFLSAPLQTLAHDAKTVELAKAAGIELLEVREGGTWDAHDHGEHDHGHADDHSDHGHGHAEEAKGHDHGHDHAEHDHGDHDHSGHGHGHDEHEGHAFDAHLWLDPENAEAMLTVIATALSAKDPANAETYKQNAEAMIARVETLEGEIEAILAPVKDKPFIVFHDAYQYLENRFGLNAVGSITVGPEVQPGAARIAELRDKIKELDAICVFSEPQFEPRLVATVIEGTGARTGVLDPLGADLADGPDLYFEMMRANAKALADCLGGTS